MSSDTLFYLLFSPQSLVHTAGICFAYWLGLYWGRRNERAEHTAQPWKWSRQSSGWQLRRRSSGHYLPEPPPMPQIRGLMSDLDQAAAALSLYVWSPDQVETVLLIANHHLDRVQAELDRVREIQRKANEGRNETATPTAPAAATDLP